MQEASHKNPPPPRRGGGGHAPPPDGNKWATRRFVASDESKRRLITRSHGSASRRTPSSVATRKKAKPICTGRPVLSGDTHTSVYCFCFSSFIYLPLAHGTISPWKESGASKACQQLVKHNNKRAAPESKGLPM